MQSLAYWQYHLNKLDSYCKVLIQLTQDIISCLFWLHTQFYIWVRCKPILTTWFSFLWFLSFMLSLQLCLLTLQEQIPLVMSIKFQRKDSQCGGLNGMQSMPYAGETMITLTSNTHYPYHTFNSQVCGSGPFGSWPLVFWHSFHIQFGASLEVLQSTPFCCMKSSSRALCNQTMLILMPGLNTLII